MENYDNIISNIINIKKDLSYQNTSQEVTLVLATKTIPQNTLMQVAEYDKLIFGENRVQEFTEKYFEHKNIVWHFIGQLQTNKVKYIIDKVSLIHSVDRLSLVSEIDKQAAKIGKVMDILIEINVANEQTKGGISIDNAFDFIKALDKYKNVCVAGLMSVMPNVCESELNNYYLQLHTLYDTIKKSMPASFRYLSVGMSGDYLIALKNGSNMVRLGSKIFGARAQGGANIER